MRYGANRAISAHGAAQKCLKRRVEFAEGDGETENVPLLTGKRGYVALDSNVNHPIDHRLELFGSGKGNGFAALALHDSDRNGWIEEAEAIY